MLRSLVMVVLAASISACPPPAHERPRSSGMDFIGHTLNPWPTAFASTRLAFATAGATRVAIYDNALVALLLEQKGDHAGAGSILEALTRLQRPDGSLPFSFDAARPHEADPYIRSGAIAWVGFAAVTYLNARREGSARDAIAKMAHEAARYLLAQQVPPPPNGSEDLRAGLVTGGSGVFAYKRARNGVIEQQFIDRKLEWTSTEHNIDTFFFLRALARMSGQGTYAAAAERIRGALETTVWNPELGQLRRGTSRAGRDDVPALDCASWGALFLFAAGDDDLAKTAVASAESRFMSVDPRTHVRGHKPYAAGPVVEDAEVARDSGFAGKVWDSTDAVWPEGSAGVALAQVRLGDRARARAIVDALEPLRDRDGALPTMTFEVPFELDMKPSVAATAWVELVREELDHPERATLVWPR